MVWYNHHLLQKRVLIGDGIVVVTTKLVRSIEVTKSLKIKYFGNVLMMGHAPLIFEERCKKLDFDNDLDTVKITLVYCIVLAMMGKDKTKGIVEKSLLDDVEDLVYFNNIDLGHMI